MLVNMIFGEVNELSTVALGRRVSGVMLLQGSLGFTFFKSHFYGP